VNISARTQYACLAVLELARQSGGGQPVPLRQISDQHQIPTPFLVQILLQLKGAGIVESVRGAAGGYRLARDPRQITLGDVLVVTEASGNTGAGPDRTRAAQVLQAVWREADRVQKDYLSRTTFAALLEQLEQHAEAMYYI
jgi:Rrf2 family protein